MLVYTTAARNACVFVALFSGGFGLGGGEGSLDGGGDDDDDDGLNWRPGPIEIKSKGNTEGC